jgi:phage tail sheath gpL-like
MTIQFQNIPPTLRVPLFYAEVNNSQANSSVANQRTLILGQITSGGAAVPNVPILSQGIGDAKTQGGVGSMLAIMTSAYRNNDDFGEVWYLPLADDPSATAATGSVAFTSAPTAAGTLSLYIAGTVVTYPVTASETVSSMATGLAAAINALSDLPVTAAVDVTNNFQVDITAKNKGLAGNDIDLRLNYLGTAGGEALPAGIGVTLTAMANGATNPNLTTALANLQDAPFDFIVNPYTDTASLNAVQAFLNDQTGRWSWERQIYGHSFGALRGTVGALTTFGTARNDQHATVMGFYDSPTLNYVWAASIAGAAAVSLRADPGLPLHTLALEGVLAPPVQSRFALTLRNTLLYDGVSTFTVAQDGTVQIEMLITTYQQNAFGQPDNSYLKVETMFLLMYVIRALATMVTSKYARVKLAADGTNFSPGSGVVTPNMIKADLIAQYASLASAGYVQNTAAFNAAVIVEKNASNPNRVDVLFPGTLINQLDIFALLFQFLLQ